MIGDFDKMLPVLIDEERGYVDDPKDPGGETNFGITWPALKQSISRGYVPADTTIKGLTVELAAKIYHPEYWDEVKGDQLPWPLCCYVFDTAVNQGVPVAIKMLQRALDVAQDGILGAGTIAKAVAKCSNPASTRFTCGRFMAFRTMRYQSTRNYDVFGEGWLIRCFELTMRINLLGVQ